MMKNLLWVFLFGFLFVYGCGKEHPEGKPVLNFKSVNTTTLPMNSIIRFQFTFNSKTVVDSIYITKVVSNCPDSDFEDSFRVPDYPTSLEKGDIDVSFVNGFSDSGYRDLRSPVCGEDDQAIFRFVLKDVDGNYSDTIESPLITILFQ